ncbi:MAG: LacI family DNA-binding transcriptional regulator, partial [Armatimonadetes bacterium]|nr:LacI family DNA-binding transcriptional regulator [Armatimonadota bacterium]
MARNNATIRSIAKTAGVSATTVHRALSDKGEIHPDTRKRILRISEQLGYYPNLPARRLAQAKTNLVGVLASSISRPFESFKVDVAVRELFAQEYEPLVWSGDWTASSWEGMVELFLSNRVVGVLIVTERHIDEAALQRLAQAEVPILGLDAGPRFPGVGVDRCQCLYEMIRRLVRRGHRRFGVLFFSRRRNPLDVDKLKGIRAALDETAGQATLQTMESPVGDYRKGVVQAAEEVLLRGGQRPTAFIGLSDLDAMIFMHRLALAGMKVPEEVAVIGFGDFPESAYSVPPLTTVALPLQQMARRVVDMLKTMIESDTDEQPAHYEEIPGQWVIRQSCGLAESEPTTAGL